MFPDQIALKINKRLKSGEDKQTLTLLKNHIFDLDNRDLSLYNNKDKNKWISNNK